MYLVYKNVNDAFRGLVQIIQHSKSVVGTPSRNGLVRKFPHPVTVCYQQPTERVLFNKARDCNPFFHLYEALWILAGRNDVASLKKYVSTIDQFSDDGVTFHGAYGYRWRHWFGYDQLEGVVEELSTNPGSRRVVLQMWDSTCNPPYAGTEWSDSYKSVTGGKDVPCNTHAYFGIRQAELEKQSFLDMTVCNRSNDVIWGMLGANVVHFSILQEYLAAHIGVEVGNYYQFTNNLHVYLDNWRPDEWLKDQFYLERKLVQHRIPLVRDIDAFDRELPKVVDSIDTPIVTEPFLKNTFIPMMAAFRAHKRRNYIGDLGAMTLIERVHSDDWRITGRDWLMTRKIKWEEKSRVKT